MGSGALVLASACLTAAFLLVPMPPTMSKPLFAVAREAAPPRVERAYSDQDVRKALRFMLAHVERGVTPPTAWAVSRMQQFMPARALPHAASLAAAQSR